MTFILINIRPEDGPVWYTSEQRNFLVTTGTKGASHFLLTGHQQRTTDTFMALSNGVSFVLTLHPPFTVSSLEVHPLGRVPLLPLSSPPAAASNRYLNPSPKS
jgi:hypothetical protein